VASAVGLWGWVFFFRFWKIWVGLCFLVWWGEGEGWGGACVGWGWGGGWGVGGGGTGHLFLAS
jgi:hypothetical protein